MKPKLFIDGEHGTTGLQIRNRLAGRDDLDVLSIPHEERHDEGQREARLREADIAILCLPDDAARQAVAMIKGAGTRIIDTSTAHRVDPDWVFGFAEMEDGHASRIARADRVSNPGCYSTGAIALIRPLVSAGILPEDYPITINAVSGYSGGGRKLIGRMEDPDAVDAIDAPYFVYSTELTHKHVPEMQRHGLLQHRPLFSPAVGRFSRGMIVQLPLHLRLLGNAATIGDIHAVLDRHYGADTQVRVRSLDDSRSVEHLVATSLVGSDAMELHVFGSRDDEQVNLVAILDNLGKGASGAALQNLDLMMNGRNAGTN